MTGQRRKRALLARLKESTRKGLDVVVTKGPRVSCAVLLSWKQCKAGAGADCVLFLIVSEYFLRAGSWSTRSQVLDVNSDIPVMLRRFWVLKG